MDEAAGGRRGDARPLLHAAVSSVIGLRRSSDVTCGDFKRGREPGKAAWRKGGVEKRRRGGEPVWAGAEG